MSHLLTSFDIFLQHTEFQSLFEWKHIWNEHIFDVFSSNQILWDPCYGVVYPTWEYIESYGTYKWHHVHIWQGVQCIHQMSLYILLSFPLTFNQEMEAYPYLGDPQRPMYSPHISIYSSQFWSTEAYMESCIILICLYAYICIWAKIWQLVHLLYCTNKTKKAMILNSLCHLQPKPGQWYVQSWIPYCCLKIWIINWLRFIFEMGQNVHH